MKTKIFKTKNLIKIAKKLEIFFKREGLSSLEAVAVCELSRMHYEAKHIAENNKRQLK